MIIGICGHARHGKDTAADFIVKHHGYRKVAFARPMKNAVLAAFPLWTEEHVDGVLKDVVCPIYGIKPRSALKSIGDAWGRGDLLNYDDFAKVTGKSLWINAALAKHDDNLIVSDVRRVNEADAIRSLGGILIMIRRTGYPVDLSHPSEEEVEHIRPDYVIRNAYTLARYEQDVLSVYRDIMAR